MPMQTLGIGSAQVTLVYHRPIDAAWEEAAKGLRTYLAQVRGLRKVNWSVTSFPGGVQESAHLPRPGLSGLEIKSASSAVGRHGPRLLRAAHRIGMCSLNCA